MNKDISKGFRHYIFIKDLIKKTKISMAILILVMLMEILLMLQALFLKRIIIGISVNTFLIQITIINKQVKR